MALVNHKITELQAAVRDTDILGSIKLPDSASLTGNTILSTACKYLRPGQGVVLSAQPFTIKSATRSSAITTDEFKDRMGNRASIEKADLYTDGNLFNLRNCAGVLAFSIDPTGTPVLHNGLSARVTERDILIDAMRSGLVVVTGGKEAMIKFVVSGSADTVSSIDRLGFANTLHTFKIYNRGSDVVSVMTEGTGGKTWGTVAAGGMCTVDILIGARDETGKEVYDVFVHSQIATGK